MDQAMVFEFSTSKLGPKLQIPENNLGPRSLEKEMLLHSPCPLAIEQS